MNELKISPLFGDGAILQRNKKIKIWGNGVAGAKLAVTLSSSDENTETREITVGDNGNWLAEFTPRKADVSATLKISNEKEEINVKDILFGDVWLLGGQSNMQLWMRRVATRYPEEIKNANSPEIRSLTVPQVYNFKGPQENIDDANWEYAVPEEIGNFSAIGYFFAKELHAEIGVPIGLIATAIGGTPIEAWMSQNDLANLGIISDEFSQLQNDDYIENILNYESKRDNEYDVQMNENDLGFSNHYENIDVDDSNWDEISLTEQWPSNLQESGVVWLRKQIIIPEQFIGQKAQLRLGTITDADEVYLDGVKIGETTYMYPPREYDIDELKAEMLLAIRVRVFFGHGGFTIGKKHYIFTELGNIDLDEMGNWKIIKTTSAPIRKEQTFFQYKQTGLYNGMIAPLKDLSITGFVFYQGESDTNVPENYGLKFQKMIQTWRKQFNQGDLPFIYVQLANLDLEPEHGWPRLREEQRQALALENTGMVTTIDVGEFNDLHPTNKKDVGIRASKLTLKLAYKKDIIASGPTPIKAVAKENKIIVSFLNAKGLNGQNIQMTLLTENNQFILEGKIADRTVELNFPIGLEVKRGWRLRYAWGNSPIASLYNIEKLPATPFEILVSVA
ncbi:MAG: 9-O-acetylesterase [Lactobacillaceae bacterium]|jgi:sialate O-acetylesterase|nr:9-O-acetylesterase [Lactobacillaceae bacterium]